MLQAKVPLAQSNDATFLKDSVTHRTVGRFIPRKEVQNGIDNREAITSGCTPPFGRTPDTLSVRKTPTGDVTPKNQVQSLHVELLAERRNSGELSGSGTRTSQIPRSIS